MKQIFLRRFPLGGFLANTFERKRNEKVSQKSVIRSQLQTVGHSYIKINTHKWCENFGCNPD